MTVVYFEILVVALFLKQLAVTLYTAAGPCIPQQSRQRSRSRARSQKAPGLYWGMHYRAANSCRVRVIG